MEKYNEFRVNNYDIPVMINQLIKIIKKYPEILSNKQWLNNDDLTIYFDDEGNLKSINLLMNIKSPLTKYFVSSIEFLDKISYTNLNGEQRIFIFDCIKRVSRERQEKDKKIIDLKPESIVEELRKYTQVTEESSQTTLPMANNEYYEILKKYIKSFNNMEFFK